MIVNPGGEVADVGDVTQAGTVRAMADPLVLPVPDTVSATYVVPVAWPPADHPIELARLYVRDRLEEPLRSLVLALAEGPLVTIDVLAAGDAPPIPVELLHVFGASEADVRATSEAAHLVVVHATYRPGWPPAHEWAARALAAGVAGAVGSPVMDTFVPQLLTIEQIERSLPDGDGELRLASWVLVPQSAGGNGLWVTTKGMGRFGLPELQAENVPPQLAHAMAQLFSGLGRALLRWWVGAVGGGEPQAFVELPEPFEVSTADVAAAYGEPAPAEVTTVALRLATDPGQPPGDSFLSVVPPDDYGRSSGEFFAEVCAALFGQGEDDVRGPADPEAMARAIATARGSLDDIRARFVEERLALDQRLLVKFRLDAPGGSEYPWLFVTSWRSPDRIHGTSANDALHDATVRVGRPLVVSADTVVDWALWVDGQGMVEGGWTDAALED